MTCLPPEPQLLRHRYLTQPSFKAGHWLPATIETVFNVSANQHDSGTGDMSCSVDRHING